MIPGGLPTRRLGRTGIEVTALGLGAAGLGNLGRAMSDQRAAATVDAAWAAGIRLFDTAPHYGLGLSERRLGAALAGRRRADYAVSTKVGRLLRTNSAPTGSDLANGFDVPDDLTRVWDLSADGVRRSLDESLGRLGLDRVDIVYLHDPDQAPDGSAGAALDALIGLREQGVVRAVGVGLSGWRAALRLVREADLDVVMLAGRWTLLDRSGEPLLAECRARGVAVVAAAPFNSGILAQPWPPDGARFDYAAAPAAVLRRARILAQRCFDAGTTLPTAAAQFPLRHPATASVVAGARGPNEVASLAAAHADSLPDVTWSALDAPIGPGPTEPPEG